MRQWLGVVFVITWRYAHVLTCLGLLTCPMPGLAQGAAESAPPVLRILAVHPDGKWTLPLGQALSVRIAYDSPQPLRFRLLAIAGDEPLDPVFSNPMPLYPAGRGEAIAWIEPRQSGYADALLVRALDARWELLNEAQLSVSLFWESGSGASIGAEPDWVAALRRVQQDLLEQATRKQRTEAGPGSRAAPLLVQLMGWSVPAYLVLQVFLLRRLSGGWRRAALVPLLWMVPVGLYSLLALFAGSNLWPLGLIFLSPAALLYLVGLLLVKRLRL